MILTSILLLLCAAIFHAATNTLMKQSRDKIAFAWWMLGAFCVFGAPFLLRIPNVEPFAWTFVVISGLLEAIYFLTLTRAYESGDLSIVYPIARGSAPLFLLLWAVAFLKERPSVVGFCGILCVVIGLYFINLPSISAWSRPLHTFRTAASRWAILTGLLISVYTAVDKVGVRYFPPLSYLYWILLITWICLSVQWLFGYRRAPLIEEIREKGSRFVSIAAAAVLGTLGYWLVLAAMKLSPVSYVAPVREVSVVFGSVIGVRYLGEQGGALRIFASSLIALGITLIAVYG